MDAVRDVMDAVRRIMANGRQSRRVVHLIILDVRNAFNLEKWTGMLGTLGNVRDDLLQILSYYLKDSSLLYETLEDQRKMGTTSGIAQGFILRPDLWNAPCDGPLRLDIPEESRLACYRDDVAALVAEALLNRRKVDLACAGKRKDLKTSG